MAETVDSVEAPVLQYEARVTEISGVEDQPLFDGGEILIVGFNVKLTTYGFGSFEFFYPANREPTPQIGDRYLITVEIQQ